MRWGGGFLYFCAKSSAGFLYFRWLAAAGLSTPLARWCTFQLLTPLVKAHHLRSKGIYTHKAFLCSLMHDCVMSTLFFGVVVRLSGAFYALGLPLVFPPLLFLELVGFKVLLPTERWVLKPVNWVDPAAFFALGIVMFSTLGLTADETQRPLHHDFAAFICVLLWTDLQFGVTHYMSHRIPWLWTRHRLHHEYGKGELNAMANLHGEAFDNVQMNAVLLLPILVCAGWIRLYPSTLPFTEWLYLIPFTHLRFQHYVINLMAFFEFDLLDMLLGHPRIGSFHTIHHEVVGRNFAIFGIVPDSVCKALVGLVSRRDAEPKASEQS